MRVTIKVEIKKSNAEVIKEKTERMKAMFTGILIYVYVLFCVIYTVFSKDNHVSLLLTLIVFSAVLIFICLPLIIFSRTIIGICFHLIDGSRVGYEKLYNEIAESNKLHNKIKENENE